MGVAEARIGRRTVAAAALVLGCVALASGPAASAADGTLATRTVGRTMVDGPITPVTEGHLVDTITISAAAGHEALVVVLDTPGGLVTSTRRIVQAFLAAPLPIIVHVAPPGADAGSAGTFILYAAHVAAMAPSTTVGAATPVSLDGAEVGDKVIENSAAFARSLANERGRDVTFAVEAVTLGRSITATEALERGVIEILATDTSGLLAAADGRSVEVGTETRVLATADAEVVDLPMGPLRRILRVIADPEVAFLLLSLDSLAIVYELANPGLGLGGAVGVVSIVLGLFALSVLPVRQAGVALLVVAAALFVAELFAPGIGVGAAGGSIALLLGGLLLFRPGSGLRVAWGVLVPTAVTVFALVVLAGILVGRTRGAPAMTTGDDLIGRTATVELGPDGTPRVRAAGSTWRAIGSAGEAPTTGTTVRIVERHNLDLVVEPTEEESP